MTDDAGDAPDDEREGGIDSPGGGPRRVVSEKSVDDILESLQEPSDEDADEDGGAAEDDSAAATAVRLSYDEERSASEDARDGDGEGEPDAEGAADEPEAAEGPVEAEDADDEGAGADRSEEGVGVGDRSSVGTGDEETNESTPDGDLAARIETGAVTGADVRAAEAGEGREATPEIDEIDLSLEDLESTSAPSASERGASTDGPLAGSLGGDASADDGDDADGSGGDGGLLGRIRSLFSRD